MYAMLQEKYEYNIGGKFSMLDTLGGGNRDLSSFHCHFSRMLDKTMPFVSRFCPRAGHALVR